MSKIALDTNAYTHLFKGDVHVREVLKKASHVYLSIIIIGELLFAFKKGKFKNNKGLLEEFLEDNFVSVLDIKRETAEIYADVRYYLENQGIPIPSNDVWIAAHAIETGSLLITYDKHFRNIPGLRVWDILK